MQTLTITNPDHYFQSCPTRIMSTLPRFSGLLLALAVIIAAPKSAPAADLVDGVAAVVNSKVITQSEVRNAVAVRAQVIGMGYQGTQAQLDREITKIRKEALQDLIDRELILDAFYREGGVIRPKFVDDSINTFIRERFEGDREKFIEELQKTGITLKSFRKMREEALIIQYMRSNQTGIIPPPTPAERKEYMRANQDRFRGEDYVKLRTLTIPRIPGDPGVTAEKQRALISEIREKIVNGADFGTMAKTYSKDSKRLKGGDWGTIERGDLKDLLSDAAFNMKPLTVSQVLEDERNLYLVYVDAIQRGKVTPLGEVEEEVDKLVMQQKRMEAHDKWIARLREDANITITSEDGSTTSSQTAVANSLSPIRSSDGDPSGPVSSDSDARPEEERGIFKRMVKILPGF